jgi:hypothetical protein
MVGHPPGPCFDHESSGSHVEPGDWVKTCCVNGKMKETAGKSMGKRKKQLV